MGQITWQPLLGFFAWNIISDVQQHADRSIESLLEHNYGGWGFEFGMEPSICSA